MENYYFLEGENRRGPFSLAQLKTYEISFDTPIWKEGRNEWVPAGEVGELEGVVEAEVKPAWPGVRQGAVKKVLLWGVVVGLVVVSVGLWVVMRKFGG